VQPQALSKAGRALDGLGGKTLTKPNQTTNSFTLELGSETAGAKLRRQKENSPDHQLRYYKLRLSGKGCRRAKTIRRLAQKQPSFNECVIAHWSSGLAPIMYRGSSLAPKLRDSPPRGWVGRGALPSAEKIEREHGWSEGK